MGKNLEKLVIPIAGMHCSACELLIEQKLQTVGGVKKVKADTRRQEAAIYYEGAAAPDQAALKIAVVEAGYKIKKNESNNFFSHDFNAYRDLLIALIILLIIYIIGRSLGIGSLSVNAHGGKLSVLIILLIGLTAGFSSCMALVGGLILGISAKYGALHPAASLKQKFTPHLLFNLGRVAAYTFFGGLLGWLGAIIQFNNFILGWLTVAVSLVMLNLGLQLISIFPWANRIKFTLPKFFGRHFKSGDKDGVYSHKKAIIGGALTFFLPCGFTQAMQIYAISQGNFWNGAAVMGLFAIGTMPGLLSIGGLSAAVKGRFAEFFFKAAGLAVIAFAIFNFHNAFNLLGWLDHTDSGAANQTAAITAAPAVIATDPNVTIENGVQIVHMTETSSGYQPNNFTVKQGLPVRWLIDAQDPYSCASVVVFRQYNIQKFLKPGENSVTFTPTTAGTYNFSCSMGMYNGSFTVIE